MSHPSQVMGDFAYISFRPPRVKFVYTSPKAGPGAGTGHPGGANNG